MPNTASESPRIPRCCAILLIGAKKGKKRRRRKRRGRQETTKRIATMVATAGRMVGAGRTDGGEEGEWEQRGREG
jgi:hypothetical protein